MEEPIRVLHVDDEPGFADLVATMLEREDEALAVETETTPAAGVARLDEAEFDCVISDYEMPETNGIGFLERVRKTRPKLRFILLTGQGSEGVASEAIGTRSRSASVRPSATPTRIGSHGSARPTPNPTGSFPGPPSGFRGGISTKSPSLPTIARPVRAP